MGGIDTSEWNWFRTSRMMQKDLEAAGVAYKDASRRYADFHALRHMHITNIGRLPVSMNTHQDQKRPPQQAKPHDALHPHAA